jgi:hypothetical protein
VALVLAVGIAPGVPGNGVAPVTGTAPGTGAVDGSAKGK